MPEGGRLSATRAVRLGLVGPGRRRNGLGPFLAAHAEAAGACVTAVAGRDLQRTEKDAEELARRLGHPVRAYGSVADLVGGETLEGLIVASPIGAHLEALRVALDAGLATLCEKPLVAPERTPQAEGLLAAFAGRGVLLMEHCQLPCVLEAFERLHPGRLRRPPAALELGISPSVRGRDMLLECLSHLLSVVQEVAPVGDATRLEEADFSTRDPAAGRMEVELRFEDPAFGTRARLVMRRCVEQPRPAWLVIDGARMDREIDMRNYTISFRAGERRVPTTDPSAALVARFVSRIGVIDPVVVREEIADIAWRARRFADVVARYDRAS